MSQVRLGRGDALVLVDVQADFVTGSLAVPRGAEVIAPLNHAIARFAGQGLPVVATRDWHPPEHSSFRAQGGPWPAHCVAGTPGAAFAAGIAVPPNAWIVSKATESHGDAYSAFQGTDLPRRLRDHDVRRLFVGGLATDYCVLATVEDALDLGYEVIVLGDAIRAVNAKPGDDTRAEARMREDGAVFVTTQEL